MKVEKYGKDILKIICEFNMEKRNIIEYNVYDAKLMGDAITFSFIFVY